MKRMLIKGKKTSQPVGDGNSETPIKNSAAAAASSNDAAKKFYESLNDPTVVERVRVTIKNTHVFKLPPRQSASGWRGGDWKEEVWVGTAKVVDRGDLTAVVLVDSNAGSIFAICPYYEGAIDRCIDSSRYFVLRVENDQGKNMFIGLAFNDRNDAFDFNTSLDDARKEREAERRPVKPYTGPTKDYSLKEGQKIHVSISKAQFTSDNDDEEENSKSKTSTSGFKKLLGNSGTSSSTPRKKPGKSPAKGLLAPPSKDTPTTNRLRPSQSDSPRTKAGKAKEAGVTESSDVFASDDAFDFSSSNPKGFSPFS